MRFFKNAVLFLAFLFIFSSCAQVSVKEAAAQQFPAPLAELLSEESQKFLESLTEVLYTLEQGGYYEISAEQKEQMFTAVHEAISRETMSLDCHTFISSAKDAENFAEELRGTFVGIGVRISVHPDDDKAATLRAEAFEKKVAEKYKDVPAKCGFDSLLSASERQEREEIVALANTVGVHGVFLLEVLPGSPAEKAGLKNGWALLTIDGTPVSGMPLSDITKIIKGNAGTTVVLGIVAGPPPAAQGGIREITVTRELVTIQQISSAVKDILGRDGKTQKIGYLKIGSFIGASAAQFEEHLRALPPEKLIIDVRGNPGGDLFGVGTMLDRLMPVGLPKIYLKRRSEKPLELYMVSRGRVPRLFFGKIVVLIDGYSASAAEIFAGVLRDHNLATLVGEKTYGKGSVQRVFYMPDGTSLKMTTELFALPSKKLIDGIGVAPDITTTDNLATPQDEVVEKALEFLLAQ
ncbi:MAG: PDZ domain-containing protein [Parcubacteria group bacterium]|nr:PDZ domain-containing protein [Parcubacteria group bacterium]MBI2049243.1 PDZ domain-containing protein [Parcubacteria group bacterium]